MPLFCVRAILAVARDVPKYALHLVLLYLRYNTHDCGRLLIRLQANGFNTPTGNTCFVLYTTYLLNLAGLVISVSYCFDEKILTDMANKLGMLISWLLHEYCCP